MSSKQTAEPGTALAAVRQISAAMQAEEFAVVASLLDERVVLHEPAGDPCPGTWEGRESVLGIFPKLLSSIGIVGPTVRQFVAGEDAAVGLICRADGHRRRSSRGPANRSPVAA